MVEQAENNGTWDPTHSRVAALAAFTGLLVGALRVKGVLSETELKDLLRLADDLAPNGATVDGTVVLTLIKRVSDQLVEHSRGADPT